MFCKNAVYKMLNLYHNKLYRARYHKEIPVRTVNDVIISSLIETHMIM